jgi:hypothetical protein
MTPSTHPAARRRRRTVTAAAVALLVVGSAAGTVTRSASADTGARRAYAGFGYGEAIAVPPTGSDQQSKLWFHDDAWWGLFFDAEATVVRIHELMPDHTWRPTDSVVRADPSSVGDALSVGDVLYVVGRTVDTDLVLSQLAYDGASRQYRMVGGFPTTITRGGSESATIARDSAGHLWVAYASSSEALVATSSDDGRTWSTPFPPGPPATTIGRGEATSVVAFDHKVGVMWSDQRNGAFRFAVHEDGSPAGAWTVETPLEGLGMADDHVNVKVVPGPPETVAAVVKTSQGDNGEGREAPLIVVLTRSAQGEWDSHVAATVADGHSRPSLVVDAVNSSLYLFATSSPGGGTIIFKDAPLDDPDFSPGLGTVVIETTGGLLTDPATTKQAVTARTGVVVLASDRSSRTYHHAELAITTPRPAADPETDPSEGQDSAPPLPPSGLGATVTGSGSVALVWHPSTDPDRWSAAADGAPARHYIVYRDGEPLGTTDLTSYGDHPDGDTARYAVVAVDGAGNRSSPSDAVAVDLSPEPAERLVGTLTRSGQVIALAMLVAAASTVLVVGRSRRRARSRGHRGPTSSGTTSGQTVVSAGESPDQRPADESQRQRHGRHRSADVEQLESRGEQDEGERAPDDAARRP